MIKRILFLFAILHCFYFSVQAQINRCGSIDPHPAILQEYDSDPSRSFNATYIIPVVFHIFYDTTIYNQPTISMAEIDTVLAQANRIINLQTNDAAFVIPYFQPIIGNLSVELRRATLDTNGNCFSGVLYHNLVSGLGTATMVYPNFAFDPNRYLNIHINQALTGFAPGAFAYFPEPYTDPAPQYDGIVFRFSSLLNDKTLVHEVGHYVGLLHTFGLTNSVGGGCGNDFVSDTPPTNGSPGNCDTAMMVCTPGVVENVQNHMDYSDDACRIMFTEGQANRVDAILNDTTLSRRYIWKPANLNATGVDTAQICNIFEGEIIYQPAGTQSCSVPNIFGFVLWSKYNKPDSVLWTTSEGIISDPESEEIEIAFGVNGPKTITLTCYYNGVSYLYTKSIYASMQTPNGLDLTSIYPHQENFESGFSLPNEHVKVLNNTGGQWQLHTGHGYNSDSCLFIPIETGVGIDTNTIVLGTFNMLNLHHPQLSFKISTAKGSNVIDRKLIVRARSLCSGDVFLYKFDYDSLFALNNTASNFFPTSTSQWKTINILLDGYFYQNYGRRDMEFSIQLIKYFEPGMVDENVFIDNINLSDTAASLPPVAGLTISNYNICGSAPTLEFSEQCTNVPDSVKWFFNGFPLFGNAPAFYNILPPVPDTSVITLIAYNSFGSDTITKLVIHRQIYWNSISANPNPICQGDTATLHASFMDADHFVWTNISAGNPNLYILSNNDSIIQVNPNNTQTFQVLATNIYGCSASTFLQVNVTSLPYVSITAPTCVYEGSTVQLSTPPGSGLLYSWSPAVGLNETDTNVVQAFIDSTITYQVTVTNNGCSFSQTTTINASPISNMVSLSVNDSVVCSNQGTMIYASGAVGASYVWGMDLCCSGTFTPMDDSLYVDPFNSSNNYFVIATDANGCTSSDTVNVQIAPNSPPFYTYPFEYAGGNTIRLCINEDSVTLYTVDNDNLTYAWSSAGGGYFTNVINNRATFHIPSPSAGFYPIIVTATNSFGCGTSNSYLVEKFWGSTEPIYTISPNSPTICEGQSVAVTLLPGANYYYYYWVDTQSISNILPLTYVNFTFNTGNGNTATIGPDTSAHYTYLVYDWWTNCVKTRDYFVQVTPAPDLLFSISDSSICNGDTSIIQVSGADTYIWSPATDLLLSGGNSVGTAFPSSTQIYTVQGTTGSCSSTQTVEIEVTNNPIVTANANDAALCAGDTAILFGSGAATYIWNNGVIDNQFFIPVASENYTVVGTDINGCSGSDSINVNVYEVPNIFLGNDTTICDSIDLLLDAGNSASSFLWSNSSTSQQYLFSPPSSGFYTIWVEGNNNGTCFDTDTINISVLDCTSSVFEEGGIALSIYPNPATQVFYINSSVELIGMDIYDVTGRKVLVKSNQFSSVDIGQLANGPYTVILYTPSIKISKRLIIAR